MRESEIKKALHAEIDLLGLAESSERMARYAVNLLVPVVRKLMEQAVREAKGKN